jgi:hypothetical protein
MHLPGGVIATTIRLLVGYFDMALAFGRLDVAIFPGQPAKDQGHAAFIAAVLCDIKFNSPFVRCVSCNPKQLGPCPAKNVVTSTCQRACS